MSFDTRILGLLGVEVPPAGVGSAVPREDADSVPPSTPVPCQCPRTCFNHPQPVGDPDLIDELLEAEADRVLFEED